MQMVYKIKNTMRFAKLTWQPTKRESPSLLINFKYVIIIIICLDFEKMTVLYNDEERGRHPTELLYTTPLGPK